MKNATRYILLATILIIIAALLIWWYGFSNTPRATEPDEQSDISITSDETKECVNGRISDERLEYLQTADMEELTTEELNILFIECL
ncbi:MAG: hypothetical protein Q8Q32_00350 [bacterium]|nr:hypothetical protein [bacterium]